MFIVVFVVHIGRLIDTYIESHSLNCFKLLHVQTDVEAKISLLFACASSVQTF